VKGVFFMRYELFLECLEKARKDTGLSNPEVGVFGLIDGNVELLTLSGIGSGWPVTEDENAINIEVTNTRTPE
jgi:hypothetical protein